MIFIHSQVHDEGDDAVLDLGSLAQSYRLSKACVLQSVVGGLRLKGGWVKTSMPALKTLQKEAVGDDTSSDR